LNFNVSFSTARTFTVKVDFATANDTASAPSDYVATSGTLTFNPGTTSQPVSVTINGDQNFEPNETLFVNLTNPVNATIGDNQGVGTILNDDAQGGFISFSQANYSVNENAGFVTLTLNRTNDVSGAATVDYSTDDTGAPTNCATVNGLASSRCDFTTALGKVQFAAGETQKTIVVLVNQDSYTEAPNETFKVNLSNLTGGAQFGSPSSATVTISDSTAPAPNTSDDTTAFVRQHYHDFLNREPDASGLAFWKDNIDKCNDPTRRPAGLTQAQCIEVFRINTSAAFFLSIEFQNTGYYVERIYKTAFGDINPPTIPVPVRLTNFIGDSQLVAGGVIVGQGAWQTQLDNNKSAFALQFVQRQAFLNRYPALTSASAFVDSLNANAGSVLTDSERSALIAELSPNSSDPALRASVLRKIADNATLQQRELSRAFVLMEYFGYLRRDPDAAPDTDFSGYNFWLNKLNAAGGNFITAEMVKSFLISDEYRRRFGP
jgi:hypothetical protein